MSIVLDDSRKYNCKSMSDWLKVYNLVDVGEFAGALNGAMA